MPPLHVYFPQEWTDLQSRLVRNHKDLWKAIQGLSQDEAIAYLNLKLGTSVKHDALLQDAGRIFINALLRKEGAIILPNGGYSK